MLTFVKMEIPVATPVVFPKSTHELYVLEQHQDALRTAEQELKQVLDAAGFFFATPTEQEETIQRIQQHPTEVYERPFMNKIAKAFLEVQKCKEAVEWASESVVDTTLTPSQVKSQVKQLLEQQRMMLERKMEDKLVSIEARFAAMDTLQTELRERNESLQKELESERAQRKAFQSKVKDFSDYVYLVFVSKQHGAFQSIPDDDFNSTIAKITGFAPLAKHFNLVEGCCNISSCNHTQDKKCPRIRSRTEIPMYLKYCKDTKSEWKDYFYPDPMFVLPTFDP